MAAVTELGDHLRCRGIEVVTVESTTITGVSGTWSWKPPGSRSSWSTPGR